MQHTNPEKYRIRRLRRNVLFLQNVRTIIATTTMHGIEKFKCAQLREGIQLDHYYRNLLGSSDWEQCFNKMHPRFVWSRLGDRVARIE